MKTGLFRFFPVVILIALFTIIVIPNAFGDDAKQELVRLFSPFPRHFNAAICNDLAIAAASANVFVSLLEIDDAGTPQPYLAEQWEVSEDGLTYTFHLHPETTFHDGVAVTSHDVLFSYGTFRKHHPLGEKMLERVIDAEAPETLIFILHLSGPEPALLQRLATPFMPILPKHVYGNTDILHNPANRQAIGSGPFRVSLFRANETFTLERFDGFLRPGRPILDRVIGMNGDNPWYAVSAMDSGTAHLFTLVEHPSVINLLADNTRLKIDSNGYKGIGALDYLEFNLRKKSLKKKEVRQAIAHAIDREWIVSSIYKDYPLALDGPLHPESPFHQTGTAAYEIDLEAAEQLLEEAGPERGEDGIRFETHLTWSPDPSGQTTKVAAYIQAQLKKIGIRLIIDEHPEPVDWYLQVAKWHHYMSINRVVTWEDPALTLHPLFESEQLLHQPGANTSGFVNEQADVILKTAAGEPNPDIRQQLYQQFQSLAGEELPIYFLYESPFVTIIDSRLQNFSGNRRGVVGPLDGVSWKTSPETE